MLVVGIDGGITIDGGMGVSVVDTEPLSVQFAETVTPLLTGTKGRSWEARLDAGLFWLETWLKAGPYAGQIVLLAYETAWIGGNPQVGLKLSTLTGGLRVLARQHGMSAIGVAPSQAKVALTKNHKADKDEMRCTARRLFGKTLIRSYHEADAVGVALAGEAIHRRSEGALTGIQASGTARAALK